jgi:flagellar motor protein MotB
MMEDGLAEEAGEGYFASISDLMVGVLFVFLLLMTVFALNFSDDKTKLQDLITRAERAEQQAQLREAEAIQLRAQNEALRARLAQAAIALERELRDREEVRAGLLRRLATRLEAGGIKFTLDQRSGVLHLSDAVPFATGRSDLSDPAARHTVDVLAKVLADVLPCFTDGTASPSCQPSDGAILETVLVEGHTDSQPYPNMTPQQSMAENDRLSTARALTVFATLRQLQPGLESLHNPTGQPLLGVSGYGQRRPLPDAVSSTEQDLTRNRRIDLRFVLSQRTSDELHRLLDQINALGAQGTP